MSLLRNLIPGQYQIGDKVFGRGTTVRVETFDIKPYDVNNQDYQVSRADEMRFGWDQLKPTTIEITFHVLNNALRPGFEDLIPNFWAEMPKVADFQREWRFDEGRYNWGAMKPLYCCDRDGLTKVIYGRPGQFTYGENTPYTETVQCLAEFRRADTLAYTAQETGVEILMGEDPTYIETQGDSEAWFRILAVGPMTNPVFLVGTQQIKLNLTLAEGVVLEISSYPWSRRVIDSNRINHVADLVGDTVYLDKLRLPPKIPVPVRWTSDEANAWVPAMGNQRFAEDIDSTGFFTLPSTFDVIGGQVSVGFNLSAFLDDISFSNDITDFGKYLASPLFGTTSAILYNAKTFNTRNQHAEAKLVAPFYGRSGIVIMSNDTMTNFLVLEVQSEVGNNWLRIRYGTAYDTYSAVMAEWQNTSPFGWNDIDTVAIESAFDEGTGDTTYTAFLNGAPKCSWTDSTNLVNTTSSNRRQGWIFDMDADLLSIGTGFRDLLAYDTSVVPAEQSGSVVLLWRDAWSTI